MSLASFSVKNSLLVNMLSVFIIVFGLFAMFNLRREAFPPVNFDTVIITTVYPGAPAEDVEKLVTIPIEEEIRGVSGLKSIESNSSESISRIMIEIEPSASDKDQVVDDIERAVDRVHNLPKEVEEDPEVVEIKSKERPVLEISLGGNVPQAVLREYAESLEDAILDIRGVASVVREGWLDPEYWVEVDPDQLKEHHVAIEEVMRALDSKNITLPAGVIRTKEWEYNIRTTGEFQTVEEIGDVVIRANDAGNWLKVKDVAKVRKTFEEESEIVKTNGKRTLTMVVIKNESADIIRLVKKINISLDEFRQQLFEGMEITISDDMSYYVKRRLNVLRNNGMIGLCLVLLVLFIFLDPIPALTTAIGLPIAFFTTFGVMYIFGITINLISMLGLIIVLGMLVDDGIIVSENVYRYVEKGMSPKEAAIKGTSEVIKPVTATILTTFAAFAPLLFMPGILGKFIKQIPIVVIIALSASLVEAFIILPAHLSDFIRKNGHPLTKKKAAPKKWFVNFQNFYTTVLSACIRHRYKFFIGLLILFVGTVILAKTTMKLVLFKDEGIEEFYIQAQAARGTSLYRMEELLKPVEQVVELMGEDELDTYRTYVGSSSAGDRHFDPSSKKSAHVGGISIYLTPSQGRKRTVHQIADGIRAQLKAIEGFETLRVDLPQPGPPVGKAIEVAIKGEKFDKLNEIAIKVKDFLSTVEGVTDLDISYQDGKKQLRVVVDDQKAKQHYVDVRRIAAAVRFAFDGGIATTVKPQKAEEEIDVVVIFDQEHRKGIEDFDKILIENTRGNLIPLMSVAEIKEVEGLYNIQHLDGKRVVYVVGNVDGKQATSQSVNTKMQKDFGSLGNEYFGYSLHYGGKVEAQKEAKRNLMISFLMAFFIIFIILTAMFNSMVQPLVVMLAIPFGMIGVVIAFFFHGEPLSFFSLMGLVALTGIVVNDSVILVDFVNKLRKEGHDRFESLIMAGRLRLRPVLMTTITTVGGLVSVAYGFGGSDPFLKPLGLSIIWGLAFATVLTLVAIPCIYAIVDDITLKIMHRATVKHLDE